MLKEYPRLRQENNANVDDEDDDDDEVVAFERSIGIRSGPRMLPAIRRRGDLRDVMMLTVIHILDVARAGQSYFGLQFECDWDDEHGAGLLMHRRRVIAFGQADVAFTGWRATADGGSACSVAAASAAKTKSRRVTARAKAAR